MSAPSRHAAGGTTPNVGLGDDRGEVPAGRLQLHDDVTAVRTDADIGRGSVVRPVM